MEGSTKQRFAAEEYNDVAYAGGFLFQLGAVLAALLAAGVLGRFDSDHRAGPETAKAGHQDGSESFRSFALLIVAGTSFALAWAGVWMILLRVFPTQVVKVSLISFPVIIVALAVLAFVKGSFLAGGIMCLMAVLAVVWVWYVWDRIDYTSHLVKTTSDTYSKSSGVFGVAVASVLLQGVWMMVLCFLCYALFGSRGGGGNPWLPLVPVILVSFYWTSQVVSNVLFVTCGGVVARWYFRLQTDEACGKSLRQACTRSFGSICMGSLIMAVVQTLRSLCSMAKAEAEEDGNAALACLALVLECIMGCIEDLVQIFNTFAFAYVAIYGMPFWEAGSQAWELMTGSDGMVQYSLMDVVSFFSVLLGAVVTCSTNALLALVLGLSTKLIVVSAVLGFFIGIAVMCVVSRMMEAGVITLFICYMEMPSVMNDFDGTLQVALAERKSLSA